MPGPSPLRTAVVGEVLVLAAVGRLIAATMAAEPRPAMSHAASIVLFVGGPLSLPWLILWVMNRSRARRRLTGLEIAFYGMVVVADGVMCVVLPRLVLRSEGFAALFIWGASLPVLILVTLLSLDGAARARHDVEPAEMSGQLPKPGKVD